MLLAPHRRVYKKGAERAEVPKRRKIKQLPFGTSRHVRHVIVLRRVATASRIPHWREGYGCKSRLENARPERAPTATPSAIHIIIAARGDCARRARRSADAAGATRPVRPAARLSTAPRDEGAARSPRGEMGAT